MPETETTTESTEQQTQEGTGGSTTETETNSTTESIEQNGKNGKEQERKPPWGSDEEFDPAKAWKLIENLRGENTDLKDKASRLKEIEDAEKSDLQKAQEALESERSEHGSTKAQLALLQAAVKHGLSEDDLELLEGVPADQIEQRAARLAQRLGRGDGDDEVVVPASRNQGRGESSGSTVDLDKVVDSIPPS